MTHERSCLDSSGKIGVFMYVRRGCVNKRVTEREDTFWPVGTSFWSSEQPSTWGAYCLLGGKERAGVLCGKKKKELRKRAIKPGISWYSEKGCENNAVSTQLLASDVSWSNGNLSAGATSWPLTSAFGKPWQLRLKRVYSTEGQSEPTAAEQRLKCKPSQIV